MNEILNNNVHDRIDAKLTKLWNTFVITKQPIIDFRREIDDLIDENFDI